MHDVRPLFLESTESLLTAPSRARPGWTTFRSRTSAEGSGWVGLARLEPGVDWPAFRRTLQDVVSDDQERIVKGMAALDGSASLVGGAVVHPGKPAWFTVDLTPGGYVLFDYPDAKEAERPRYQPLAVEGEVNGAPPPAEPAGTIRAVTTAEGPRYEVLGMPTAGAPLAFENRMERPYAMEAVLFPLPRDSGEGELADFFGAFVDGSTAWPPSPPFGIGSGSGSLPLSSGRRQVVSMTSDPGRHVVVNWLKDPWDGVRLAKRGHYRILHLA